jgi:hypothetical protein
MRTMKRMIASTAIRPQVAGERAILLHSGEGVRDFSSSPSHPQLPALQR